MYVCACVVYVCVFMYVCLCMCVCVCVCVETRRKKEQVRREMSKTSETLVASSESTRAKRKQKTTRSTQRILRRKMIVQARLHQRHRNRKIPPAQTLPLPLTLSEPFAFVFAPASYIDTRMHEQINTWYHGQRWPMPSRSSLDSFPDRL